MRAFHMAKRSVIVGLLVVLISSFPPSRVRNASAAGKKPYAGTTLRVVLANHPWTVAIQPLISSFEKQTGISVKIESYGEDQLTQKLTTEFVAGTSDIDVFMQRPLQEERQYVKNGWYSNLKSFLINKKKTPASYDLKDFAGFAMRTETTHGFLTGIPIVTESEVLYYRKDVLKKNHMKPPTTLVQLQKDAAKLTSKDKQFYGFVARGLRAAAVTQFSSFLYSFGGDWYNRKSMKATLNTPEAIKAFQFYGGLLRNDGPPGVLNMSWPQASVVFSEGNAAFYTDASSLWQNMLDPTKSKVASKTGVAPFPAGSKGSKPYDVTSWGLSMSANAPHKDAAWEFIKWATSKATTTKIQENGAVPGARTSVWKSKHGTKAFPKDWVAATNKEQKTGRQYDRPLVIQVGPARDIIGSVIVAAIEGKDVKAAAKAANSQFQQQLDSEK